MLLVDNGVVIDGTYIKSSYFVQFCLFLQSKDIPIGLDQVCEESGIVFFIADHIFYGRST